MLTLARLLPRFVERYPQVEVDVRVDDQLVDIVDAGIRLVEALDG
jgi:DNA-binding transcriptional LysR family regulator